MVLAADGSVDTAATDAARAGMAKDRVEGEIFNFGPDMETLRAACETETGLPAPTQPRWYDRHRRPER